MSVSVRAARWCFALAGVYGLAATLALYLPPAGADPLFRWAFAGAAGATQLLYLLIASDPVRFRPAIPVGIVSKLSFAAPAAWLWAQGRTGDATAVFGAIDVALAAMFGWWWLRLRSADGMGRRR